VLPTRLPYGPLEQGLAMLPTPRFRACAPDKHALSQRALLTLGVLCVLANAGLAQSAGADPTFFEARIRPVLVEHCYQCHSAEAQKLRKLKGGLLLDTRAGLRKGGETGPAIVPGKPGESLLLKALRHDELRMPPKGKLPEVVLADFEKWIAQGAVDPRDGGNITAKAIDWQKARQAWALQQPKKAAPPATADPAWPRSDIDRFVLTALEARGLKPSPSATKIELIRRATFDLLGLPPTPAEIDAFLRDESPDAFARVVERLLHSPHYGERWGRYWLDIARYADDKALAVSTPRQHAYRYRDWVIQALNDDMPYDRFLQLQIAGDLLKEPSDPFVRLGGLGFQGLGAEYHRGNFAAQVMADELDDRIDTLTRGLLGLTVACARCHDHKYDPISTRDYYALAAAYQGSSLVELPAAPPIVVERFQKWQQEDKKQEADLNRWLQEQGKQRSLAAVADVGEYLHAVWKVQHLPAGDTPATKAGRLSPYFLNRLSKHVQAKEANAIAAPLRAWTEIKDPARAEQWAEQLQKDVRAALQAKEKQPEQAALLKALVEGKGPFAVPGNEVGGLLDGVPAKDYAHRKAALDQHKKAAPPAPLMVHGVQGGGQKMRVHIRGKVDNLGEEAPPGFLSILRKLGDPPPGSFTRFDLARAITAPENPLTARVIVNRVWQLHFGRGIVGTASNFGALGEQPSHPELLDTLAVSFMESGWSLKKLHRAIMLSAVYQQSAQADAANLKRDPENRYLWRMTPRRLDLEAWRDALLAVSGRLDLTLGGPSFALDSSQARRTLYAKVSRAVPDAMAALFDFPDANATSERRNVTTVPQQQLFVLNSPLMIESARAFAVRLEKAEQGPEGRIALAYRLALGRSPEAGELQAALEFVRTTAPANLSAWEQFAQVLLASNEFAWID
jgi:hypothetical protein